MRKFIKAGICYIMLIFILTGCAGSYKEKPETALDSDKVIIGKIYTGNENGDYVEAIAIKGDTIVFAGKEADVKSYIGDNTEITELEDTQFAMAGFEDVHNHSAEAWEVKLQSAMIPQGASQEECLRVIREFVKAHPDSSYYMAKGWLNSAFENDCPTKELLDEIEDKKPIIAYSLDGHSTWVNSAALKNANITKDTEDPEGGTIERYEDGTPNGCLRDNACVLPERALPKQTVEDKMEAILAAQEEYASLGYVATNEAYVNEKINTYDTPRLEAYERLDKEGKLSTYCAGSFIVGNHDDYEERVNTALEWKEKTAGGMFEVTDIKIFVDGVVEGQTALLSEPYSNDPNNYGATSWETDEDLERLSKIVELANDQGMTVHFHAIGDQASMNAVNAVEKAAGKIGIDKVRACRNVIVHLQVVDPSIMEKMAYYNIVGNLNPWCKKLPGFYENEEKFLGEERVAKEYPVKSFLDKGVAIAFGSDYGSSSEYDPIECFDVFVTRMDKTDPGDGSTQLNPAECLTQKQALAMMTSGGAYQLHKENEFGTIEVGKKAYLAVLSQDILQISKDDIMKTKVLKTMVNGEWTYHAKSAK